MAIPNSDDTHKHDFSFITERFKTRAGCYREAQDQGWLLQRGSRPGLAVTERLKLTRLGLAVIERLKIRAGCYREVQDQGWLLQRGSRPGLAVTERFKTRAGCYREV